MLYEIDGQPAFRIDLYNHSVASKWKELISDIYVGDGEDIDHIRTFFSLRSTTDKREMLLDAIKSINSFLKKEFIVLPEVIDWNGQEIFNTLHVAFEKLSGEFDNPTKLMKIAPMHIKEKIRDLNYCVHHLERDQTQKSISLLNLQWTKKRETLERIRLEDNEYSHIQFNQNKNEAYLAYNELGKNYIDLWKDDLPITYEASKNNHYIGPDIIISFENKETIFEDGFLNWCKENKVDPYNKTHGIGLLPIGKVEKIGIEHLTKDSKANIIIERN